MASRVLAGVAVSCALAQPVLARQAIDDGTGTIAVQQLPNEAQLTLERIEAGGPFPYAKDGSRFGNYERVLPQRSRGYYREYTVKTNSRNRGARRIVCGGDQRATSDCYYTDDHYNSFKRIAK
ncbi:ribonuclease [Burkholderiaceae bacterium 16]|nr:ribonuclease [Burkholderiaceae bacterium 16]